MWGEIIDAYVINLYRTTTSPLPSSEFAYIFETYKILNILKISRYLFWQQLSNFLNLLTSTQLFLRNFFHQSLVRHEQEHKLVPSYN